MEIFWILLIILVPAIIAAFIFLRRTYRGQRILQRFGLGYSYRDVEKNVFVDMPEKMSKKWKSPKGAEVFAASAPTAWEYQLIDEAISYEISRFSKPFQNFQPADFGQKATMFKSHEEYRVWLLEHPTSIIGAETEEIKGFPIIRTHASSTGYASGITGGIKMLYGGGVKPTYPFIVVPRLKGEWADNERARAYLKESIQNEAQHLLASNDGNLYNFFVGDGDRHPFMW